MKLDINQCRIGDQGTAKTRLSPSGIVELADREFSARAIGGAIDEGAAVLVTGADHGGLIVRIAADEISSAKLAGFGQPVYDSFGDQVKAKAAEAEEERQQERKVWQKKSSSRRIQIGGVFAIIATWLLLSQPQVAAIGFPARVAYGALFFVAAFAWAIIVFQTIDYAFQQIDEDFVRLASFSTIIALCGSVIGLWAISSLGVTMGLGLAIFCTLVGAAIVPIASLVFLCD